MGLAGTTLLDKTANLRFELPLVGLFNAYNALQAITAAQLLGINSTELEKQTQVLGGAPGRLERVHIEAKAQDKVLKAPSDGPTFTQRQGTEVASSVDMESIEKNYPSVFIDYAHTPDALENICSTLAELKNLTKSYLLFLERVVTGMQLNGPLWLKLAKNGVT